MVKKWKQFIIGVAVGGGLAMAGPASGAGSTISAFLANHITFSFDGVQKSVPTGYAVLTYQDRTYVPARFVAEELGAVVGWDDATNTVTIHKNSSEVTQPQLWQNSYLGLSRSNPAGLDQKVTLTKKGWLEEYKASFTLKEVIRGDAAWELIRKANFYNDAPKQGYEYLLAKIQVQLVSNKDDEKQLHLSPVFFTLVSKTGKDYQWPMVVAPHPSIESNLYVGASHEGWAVFEVKKEDETPLITYGRDYEGKGGVWFKAY